jgi:prefoldin alpha subunit
MTDKPVDKKKQEQVQKLQQKYMELQMLDQQMKQAQKQVEAIEQHAMELDEIQQGLDALANSKQGSEMWVPISNGIFVKARLEDNKSLAVNVGGNVVAKKDVPSTKAMLAEQAAEMRKFQAELVHQVEKAAERAAALQQELQEVLGA